MNNETITAKEEESSKVYFAGGCSFLNKKVIKNPTKLSLSDLYDAQVRIKEDGMDIYTPLGYKGNFVLDESDTDHPELVNGIVTSGDGMVGPIKKIGTTMIGDEECEVLMTIPEVGHLTYQIVLMVYAPDGTHVYNHVLTMMQTRNTKGLEITQKIDNGGIRLNLSTLPYEDTQLNLVTAKEEEFSKTYFTKQCSFLHDVFVKNTAKLSLTDIMDVQVRVKGNCTEIFIPLGYKGNFILSGPEDDNSELINGIITSGGERFRSVEKIGTTTIGSEICDVIMTITETSKLIYQIMLMVYDLNTNDVYTQILTVGHLGGIHNVDATQTVDNGGIKMTLCLFNDEDTQLNLKLN